MVSDIVFHRGHDRKLRGPELRAITISSGAEMLVDTWNGWISCYSFQKLALSQWTHEIGSLRIDVFDHSMISHLRGKFY